MCCYICFVCNVSVCSRSQHMTNLSPLPPWCPVCILLCQCSTPAAVWERTQRRQLSVPICIPGTSLDTEAPPGMPRSEDDAETDLCYAEDDETSQKQRGCCCCCSSCCQVRNDTTANLRYARHYIKNMDKPVMMKPRAATCKDKSETSIKNYKWSNSSVILMENRSDGGFALALFDCTPD